METNNINSKIADAASKAKDLTAKASAKVGESGYSDPCDIEQLPADTKQHAARATRPSPLRPPEGERAS